MTKQAVEVEKPQNTETIDLVTWYPLLIVP